MPAPANTLEIGPSAEQWPTLGLGTWRLGESARAADHEIGLIRQAAALGYRLFDTAEMYGEGGAERVLGQALDQALHEPGLQREQLRIVSKAYPHHGERRGSAACMRCQPATAATRDHRSVPAALARRHPAGRNSAWLPATPASGVDTLLGRQQFRRRTTLTSCSHCPRAAACAANQVYYSLNERGVEFDLLPRMRKQRMPLMAYCPIDGGRLAQHARLAKLAASLNISAAQLALAWLLRQPGVIAIPKAGRDAHLIENWQSRDLLIPESARSELETMFPKPARKRGLAMR